MVLSHRQGTCGFRTSTNKALPWALLIAEEQGSIETRMLGISGSLCFSGIANPSWQSHATAWESQKLKDNQERAYGVQSWTKREYVKTKRQSSELIKINTELFVPFWEKSGWILIISAHGGKVKLISTSVFQLWFSWLRSLIRVCLLPPSNEASSWEVNLHVH